MKKSVLVFTMTILLFICGMNMATAQDQPKPKKDTINMDSNAKPQFYYPVEDDKSKGGSTTTIAIIIGAVVVASGAAFFLLKKKK